MRAGRTHSVARLEPCGEFAQNQEGVKCMRKMTCEVYLCTEKGSSVADSPLALCFVAASTMSCAPSRGRCMAMTCLSLVLVRISRKWWATLKKRWETRDQMIGPKPDDQKELRVLNRTLRWCKDGLVLAANLRHGREVVDELGLSKSKPASSPATVNGATRCQGDELKPLDEEGKRLYQRIVAKLNYLAHDRLDLKYATSCLASAVSSPGLGDMQAAKRVGRFLRKAPVAWQGFPFHDPRPESSCATRMPTGPQTRLLEGRRAEVS